MAKAPLNPVELAAIERVEKQTRTGTYYGLLGLDLRASKHDVESAYREYVRDWHPDRFFSRDAKDILPVIDNNFVEVTRAYKTLRDDSKRTIYDADLREQGITVAEVGGVARDERVGFEVKRERTPSGTSNVSALSDVRFSTRSVTPLGAHTVAPAAPPAPPPPPVPQPPSPTNVAVNKLRSQIAEQLARAKAYYDAGLEDFNAGRYSKAESGLYLAMRYDARNQTYADLFKQAQHKALQLRCVTLVSMGQQAEQYGNTRDALANYRKAVECEPDEGVAYFRLAQLQRQQEEEPRECLALLRKAVQKEPKRAEFRIALGELYNELKMGQNALREAQAAVELEPRNEKAKSLLKLLKAAVR